MKRDKPPFRVDHVGSLLRPPELLKAREDFAENRTSSEELRADEDDAIKEAVEMQGEIDLQSATDGEFRRASWHMDFIYKLDEISKAPGDLKARFENEDREIKFTPAAMHIGGKLGVSEKIFGDDFEFLKDVANSTPKLTIPSPSMVHYTVEAGRPSLRIFILTWILFGGISHRRTRRRCVGSGSLDARISNSTTRASRI